MTSMWISLMRRALGSAWKPDRVTVTVADPRALPVVFHGIRALRGDRLGFQMRFPASWLTMPFDQSDFWAQTRHEQSGPGPSTTIVDSVRQVLKPLIGDGSRLSVARAPATCRMDQRNLSRQLAAAGSSLAAIIDELYHEAACEALAGTDRPLSEIAATLGYSDATALSRAFKRWTGQTPLQYRRRHAPDAP